MLVAMRQIAVFIAASLAIFLGLLALLIALALADGHGLISCREDCSPSRPLLGEVPPWRTIVAALLSLTAGAVAARRYG
jgi:hypothetical protein